MKKYRYKPTGQIFTKAPSDYACYPEVNHEADRLSSVPYYIVRNGSDWEEIKEGRNPIVTLQWKGLFYGDKYYLVTEGWAINELTLEKPDGTWYYQYEEWNRHFNSRELAEQFVRDNKPVYPAPIVEDVLNLLEGTEHYNSCVMKLKLFKKAHETL